MSEQIGAPAHTLPGVANYFMPDREAEMPPHTSDFFFSSQLIVLPKLNDLFLELKEMQCREKGTDKAQGREGGSRRERGEGGRRLRPSFSSRGTALPPHPAGG